MSQGNITKAPIKKPTAVNLAEFKDKKIQEVMNHLDLARSKVTIHPEDALFDYYYMASLQYAKDRLDYNHYSHAMSKKDRQKAYLALVYAQGCIKALEFVLGLADNFVKPTGSGVDQNDDN